MRTFSQVFGFVFSFLLIFPVTGFSAAQKVALILDRGGKDDRSFNSAAYAGATKAQKEFGIQLKDIEAGDDTLFEPAMRSFIKKEYDLIIAIGVAQAEAVKRLAKEFPQQRFAVVDAIVEGANVRSLMFAEHEGSFLMGAIAAMKTKTGTIGFIGGVDMPLIRRFQVGFENGAANINPKIKVLTNYIGVTGEAWNNPTKAKELATSQFGRNADIVFVAAGNSNNGVFDAAEQKQKFAIGVDSNQNGIKPGRILTSMLKRVDLAVFDSIKDLTKGEFKGGLRSAGLKDNGVDWALDENNKSLFSSTDIEKINSLKKQIIAGKIKPKDYYKK